MARPSNPNYKVVIINHDDKEKLPHFENDDHPEYVVGYLPEHINLRIQSDWEPIFSNFIPNMLGSLQYIGGILGGQSGFTGVVPFIKAFTGQVWRSSEPLDFELRLLFDARVNTITDVSLPVEKLLAWASPRVYSTGLIEAPGPTIANQNKRVSLRIGRFIYMPSVIFPTIDVQWYTAPEKSGQFIAADVDIHVRSFFTYLQHDILNMFQTAKNENFDQNWFDANDIGQPNG